jgi:DNA-binding CsgD family transcriptional regulator
LDDDMARCAAELAAEVTGIHLTGVALFDTEGCLKMQAVFGHRTRTWAELSIPHASIAHRVRRTGRVASLSNYARESGCAPWLIDMFCGGEGAVALAAVPLRLGDEVIGVLYGGVREPIEIGDRVLYALDRVARLTSATAWSSGHPVTVGPTPEADGLPVPELTIRETEMLVLLADGVSTREIAERTGLTVNSVRTYIQSTLTKLGAGSRLEAVARARALELL